MELDPLGTRLNSAIEEVTRSAADSSRRIEAAFRSTGDSGPALNARLTEFGTEQTRLNSAIEAAVRSAVDPGAALNAAQTALMTALNARPTLGELLSRWMEHLKNLLRRLGVPVNLDDDKQLWLRLWAAIRPMSIPEEEFWMLTPWEAAALLEQEVWKLDALASAIARTHAHSLSVARPLLDSVAAHDRSVGERQSDGTLAKEGMLEAELVLDAGATGDDVPKENLQPSKPAKSGSIDKGNSDMLQVFSAEQRGGQQAAKAEGRQSEPATTRVPLPALLRDAQGRTADPKLRKKLVAVLQYNRYLEDLKVLKTACKRHQTHALLEQRFPNLDVWAALDDADRADIVKGDFQPGFFAWSLVQRTIGLSGRHNRTLKNYRSALRKAGLL